MEAKHPQENALLTGVIWKQILLFFLPVALGTFFQQMYNTVDALVVGNFVGMNALGAVGGATASVINLILGFFVGVSSGATVVIAQQYGAGNREPLSRVVHTTAALSLATGAALTVVGVLFVPGTLTLLHQPEELMADSVTYLRIYFAGSLGLSLYNSCMGILQAEGDSRHPLYYLIISSVTNVCLDLLFIGAFRMGVGGVAIATILAQFLSAALCLRRLHHAERQVHEGVVDGGVERGLVDDGVRPLDDEVVCPARGGRADRARDGGHHAVCLEGRVCS